MFGKKRKHKATRLESNDASFGTVIGEGTLINGNLTASGGLRVDGQVMGDIDIRADDEAVLAIGEEGKIQGNIRGNRIIIGGTVLGNIEARDWVELRAGSHVSGDIHYKTLSIEPGAKVAGQLLNGLDEPGATPQELPAVVSMFGGER